MSDTLVSVLGLTIGWGLIALGALLILRALFADRSRGRRRCPRCWYSMDGVPSVQCPECGRSARKERRLFKTRRRYRFAFGALSFVVLGRIALYAGDAGQIGWARALPTSILIFVSNIPRQPESAWPDGWRSDLMTEFAVRLADDNLLAWHRPIVRSRIERDSAASAVPLQFIDCSPALSTDWYAKARRDYIARHDRPRLGVTPFDPDTSYPTRKLQIKRVHKGLVEVLGSNAGPPEFAIGAHFAWRKNPGEIELLEKLITAISQATPTAPCTLGSGGSWDAWNKTYIALESRRITMDLPDATFEEVRRELEKACGFPITVDWPSARTVGVEPDSRSNLRNVDATIPDALTLWLDLAVSGRDSLRWKAEGDGITIVGAPAVILDLGQWGAGGAPPANEEVFCVFDVRDILVARLVRNRLPHMGGAEFGMRNDATLTLWGEGWFASSSIINGRLVLLAHAKTHVLMQRRLDKIRRDESTPVLLQSQGSAP